MSDNDAKGDAGSVTIHPGTSGSGSLTLVPDATMFTVEFSTERFPLSPQAQAVLREHSAPVAEFPRYGIRVYDGRSQGTRDGAVGVLNKERAVQIAAPVLHRHRSDGDEVYLTRYVLAQFWPEVDRKRIDATLEPLGASVVEELSYAANGYRLLAPPQADGMGAISLANALRETGLTQFAHPDLVSQRHKRAATVMERAAAPAPAARDADLLTQQWHLTQARVTSAWTLTKGLATIAIAILDDGVDVGHPEFSGALKVFAQHDFTAGTEDGNPKTDDDKHGTACAGVAAANGLRASGAAPDCSLLAVRFPATLGDSDEADMFRWAADNGADVISCSWGPADGTGASDPLPGATQAAIHYCVTQGRGGKGIPILWAAGNGNESVDLDGYASNPAVIAVAACTDRSRRAWYSDKGDAIWVCAPSSGDRAAGEKSITTTDRQGAAGYNNGGEGIDANYTNSFGGTSSAAPLVAGIVGLMLSANPDMTADEVRTALRDTATQIGTGYVNGHSPEYGYGQVDAYEAVRHAQAAAGGFTPAPGQPSIIGPTSTNRFTAPAFEVDPGGGPAMYYAVEVATNASFLDGGDHSNESGFYGTWQDSPFQAASPWRMPADVWQRMCGASAIYYRAWFSTSANSWEGVVVTTADADYEQAPSVEITDGAGVRAVNDVPDGAGVRAVRDGRDSQTGQEAGTARASRDAVAMHAGFDRLTYPGDDVMTALWNNTNMAWCGFYLAPAPSQGTGWMGKAAFLRGLGWGLAPVYVGQQWTGGPGSHILTAAQGTTDAADAIRLAETAGIGTNSVIYLDIEIGGRLPASFMAYVQAWIDGVRGSDYRPGVYCSCLDTPAQIQASNPDVYFWVFNINKYARTDFRAPDGSFRTPDVADSGCRFATAWQYIQGASNVPVQQDDGSTKPLSPVDLDCANVLDPSQPSAGATPAPAPAGVPTITGPATATRGGPAPQFDLAPAPGSNSSYYAVEVASDPALFDSGDHGLGDGFHGSWQDGGPFLSANPYQLTDTAWQALQSAEALYYRAWFSSSDTVWADVEVTTSDADAASAPSLQVVAEREGDNRLVDLRPSRGSRSAVPDSTVPQPRGRSSAVLHPHIVGPSRCAATGDGPRFTVTLPPSAQSWRLECATDLTLLGDNFGDRDPANYWMSEVMPATITTLTLPVDGWHALHAADRIYYRVACSPQPDPQRWYAQDWSTSPVMPDSAPWVDVVTNSRERATGDIQTLVSDPDELMWRGR